MNSRDSGLEEDHLKLSRSILLKKHCEPQELSPPIFYHGRGNFDGDTKSKITSGVKDLSMECAQNTKPGSGSEKKTLDKVGSTNETAIYDSISSDESSSPNLNDLLDNLDESEQADSNKKRETGMHDQKSPETIKKEMCEGDTKQDDIYTKKMRADQPSRGPNEPVGKLKIKRPRLKRGGKRKQNETNPTMKSEKRIFNETINYSQNTMLNGTLPESTLPSENIRNDNSHPVRTPDMSSSPAICQNFQFKNNNIFPDYVPINPPRSRHSGQMIPPPYKISPTVATAHRAPPGHLTLPDPITHPVPSSSALQNPSSVQSSAENRLQGVSNGASCLPSREAVPVVCQSHTSMASHQAAGRSQCLQHTDRFNHPGALPRGNGPLLSGGDNIELPFDGRLARVDPYDQPTLAFLEKRINVEIELKEFLCEISSCKDSTCFIARKHLQHTRSCQSWYDLRGNCSICFEICNFVIRSTEREGENSTIENDCEPVTLESVKLLYDPVFLDMFLAELGTSREELESGD